MTTESRERKATETLTIDRAYFREQAREAARTFVAPLAGVYRALHAPLDKGRKRV